jgi:nucleoside phosphorylase
MKSKRKTICIVAAMKDEILPLYVRLAPEGAHLKKGVVEKLETNQGRYLFFVSGVGQKMLQKNLPKLAPYRAEIDALWFIGVCGALRPTLTVGETLEFTFAVEREGTPIFLDDALDEKKRGLVTTIGVAHRAEKERLGTLFPEALAVDMEGAFIAEWCREQGVPCRVLKTVSDSLTADLPDEHFLYAHYNERSFFKLVKAFFCEPVKMYQMIRLKRGITKAIMNNTQYVLNELKER